MISRIFGMVDFSGRGSDSAFFISAKIFKRPRCACDNARSSVWTVKPSDLMSNWKVVMPVSFPAT